jgi:hypothetical protein
MNIQAHNWPVAELVSRCCRRPAEEIAWQEFVSRFHSTILSNVRKTYRHKIGYEGAAILPFAEKIIDDLVEAVYLRLAESRSQVLKRFRANQADSMYQYLAIISCRTVLNHILLSSKQKKEDMS